MLLEYYGKKERAKKKISLFGEGAGQLSKEQNKCYSPSPGGR